MKYDIDIKLYCSEVIDSSEEIVRIPPYRVVAFEGTEAELDEEIERIQKYAKIIGIHKIES